MAGDNGGTGKAEVATVVIFVRGAGYGAALGALFGFLIFPVVALLASGGDRIDLQSIVFGSLLLGPFGAVVGVLYGLVAGLGAAAAIVLLPIETRRSRGGFVVSLTAAALVGGISWLVFRPSMTVGGNETTGHVIERVVLFYAYPCGSAVLAGMFAGRRLVAPVRVDDTPSWATDRAT